MTRREVLMWCLLLAGFGTAVAFFILRPGEVFSRSIVEAVVHEDVEYVRHWSGDVNQLISGEHLLDVATGPKGGSRVVREWFASFC